MLLETKRRTVAEEITRSPIGEERVYLKIPLRQLVDISLNPTCFSVDSDIKQIKVMLRRLGRETCVSVHTHPLINAGEDPETCCRPSAQDIHTFLNRSEERTMIIAARELAHGIVLAYSFTRKTLKTPKIENKNEEDKLESLLNPLLSSIIDGHVRKLMAKYHLQYRTFSIDIIQKDWFQSLLVERQSEASLLNALYTNISP